MCHLLRRKYFFCVMNFDDLSLVVWVPQADCLKRMRRGGGVGAKEV